MHEKSSVDFSGIFTAFDLLQEQKTSLARSMAVAAGKVIRDEARQRVPVESGKLRDAIYLAFNEHRSTATRVEYSISWNAGQAPHGHLLEFGHWRTNPVYLGPDGQWHGVKQGKKGERMQPRWVPAQPFLRPALEATWQRAEQAMLQRGRERLQEILIAQHKEHVDAD